MSTMREVTLLRLAAQGLADPGAATPAGAVRHMTCMQGQDYPGTLRAIALRTGGGQDAVRAAMDRGEVVRSWPLRGTLHALCAEDLPWIVAIMGERFLAGAQRRRDNLGIDDAIVGRARELAVARLEQRERLSRAELMDLWEGAGLLGVKSRGYHLLWHLAQSGLVCFGPTDGAEQQIVLVEQWIPEARVLEGEEALAELALRYFRSHGPATVKDFIWWTKLPAREARAGVAAVQDRLEQMTADGTTYLLDPGTPEALAACRERAEGVFLLPGFDEYVLGYQDRGAALPAEHADRIVPGNNGVFRPTIVAGGQIVGTWKRNGARRTLELEPFTRLGRGVAKAAEALV